MKTIRPENLASRLESLAPHPRIVAPGNFATPQALLKVVDEAIPTYTLHMLNAQGNVPTRPGVTHETTFVGPGMRRSPTLMYYPCRFSLTPVILRQSLPVDVLLLHTSTPPRRRGVDGPGGQHPAGRARGGAGPRRLDHRAGEPADAAHLRRRPGPCGRHRLLHRGRRTADVAGAGRTGRGRPGHRRPHLQPDPGRRDAATGNRGSAGRGAGLVDRPPRAEDLVGDVLRRSPGTARIALLRHRRAADRFVRVRQPAVVRLARLQQIGPDAPHRGDQQPGRGSVGRRR